MSLNPSPRVTVAFPLFRSARFLDVIRGNLIRLAAPDLEILISDRHLHDDALDRLEAEFGADPRIRFIRHRDGVGWVDHFNALLLEARGRYFMWMPHDDDFPEDYVPRLASALDAHPRAVLAFGSIRIKGDGARGPWRSRFRDPGELVRETWSPRLHLKLLTQWNPGIAFRGLFRREPLVQRSLLIRHTRGDVLADFHWVFATGFLGPWSFVPDCVCEKRLHAGSAHAQWNFSTTQWTEARRVLAGYIADLAPRPRDAAFARLVLSLWIASNLVFLRIKKRSRISPFLSPVHGLLRSVLKALLGGRRDSPHPSAETAASPHPGFDVMASGKLRNPD